MASWATFRFHSGVIAGGFTNVILWMICQRGETASGSALQLSACGLKLLRLLPSVTDLLDLLPEEPRDGGSGVEGDLHVIGGVQ